LGSVNNFSQGVWKKKSFEIKKAGKISSLKNTFEKSFKYNTSKGSYKEENPFEKS